VKPTLSALAERLGEIRGRIADAAARSGRSPSAVTLVGAVKAVPVERVREAIGAGLTDLGENRVQEARQHLEALGRSVARWHMIGHLQRNKVGRAIEWFDRIHGVDSIELATALARLAVPAGRTLPMLIQVNVSRETTKHGVDPQRLHALLAEVAELPGVVVDGLMTIGMPGGTDAARREFAATRELRDAAERALGIALPQLSMGMSGDYEVAVEEGSTLVRVGTALFGPRG
jgi:pyridoxal phosphate enzyme (YggS family)